MRGPQLFAVKRFSDQRGWFSELFASPHAELTSFVQDNLSFSQRGVLRGMHFQRRPGQAKLISVLEGEIFDVFVDLRPNSKTYLHWESVTLTPERQLFLPVGFAHGFCALSDALVHYKVSSPYDPTEELGFAYDDPEIGIQWPIREPILSERDRQAPRFSKELLWK